MFDIKLFGKENLFSNFEKIMLFLLLLSFMGVYGYSLHLMVVTFVVLCFKRLKLYTTIGVLPPLLLTVALIITSSFSLSPSVWMTWLVWPVAFLVGFGLIRTSTQEPDCQKIAERRLERGIFIAAIGFFAHILLNLYTNIGVEDLYRNTLDFWTKDVMAATGQAGLACVPLGWATAYLFTDRPIKTKILAMAAILAMLYYNLTLGSRSMVVSLVILLGVMTILLLLANYKSTSKKRTVRFVLILTVLLIVFYSVDAWGVRSMVADSVLAERLNGTDSVALQEDSRWSNKWEYIKLMPYYWSGGGYIYSAVGSHAHDVLLDTYDEAGILAFIAVLLLLWDGISKLIWILRSKQYDFNTKSVLFCVYLTILMTFMVEPILVGMPWLLMTFCFLHGGVTALVKQKPYSADEQK